MKKTYVTPEIESLDFFETACHTYKDILSSTGEVIGQEKVEIEVDWTKNNACNGSNGGYYGDKSKKKYYFIPFWPFW